MTWYSVEIEADDGYRWREKVHEDDLPAYLAELKASDGYGLSDLEAASPPVPTTETP